MDNVIGLSSWTIAWVPPRENEVMVSWYRVELLAARTGKKFGERETEEFGERSDRNGTGGLAGSLFVGYRQIVGCNLACEQAPRGASAEQQFSACSTS